MTSLLVNVAEIFTVLSNLSLLIPAITATYYRRIFRAAIFYSETFVSATYHFADYTGHSLYPFTFTILHHLDFWHAQMIMILNLLYLVHFSPKWLWLEWVLIFLGGMALVILQITLPGELYVQAAVAGVFFFGIAIYWVVYYLTVGEGSLPEYNWEYLTISLALLSASSFMYTAQLIWPQGYWLAHSIWHIAAAQGSHYMFYTKEKAPKYANAAKRITRPLIRL